MFEVLSFPDNMVGVYNNIVNTLIHQTTVNFLVMNISYNLFYFTLDVGN